MPSHHHIIESTDVDEHAALFPQWDQRYEQASAGRFKARLEELVLGPLHLFRESMNAAVLMRSAPPQQVVTLATFATQQGPIRFCGRSVQTGQVARLAPGQEFDFVSRDASDMLVVGVDEGHLRRYAEGLDGLELEPAAEHHAILAPPRSDAASLSEMLRTVLALASDAPHRLEHERTRLAITEALYDEVIGLGRLPAWTGQEAAPPIATRQWVVRAARDHMRKHVGEAIGVAELCQALHVSRRTLQYSFQDVLQMSPAVYLRMLRLNGMRRELRQGGAEAIGDRAARWGFWHLSRFAADYRRMFGELPSHTLQRARAR